MCQNHLWRLTSGPFLRGYWLSSPVLAVPLLDVASERSVRLWFAFVSETHAHERGGDVSVDMFALAFLRSPFLLIFLPFFSTHRY